MMDKLINNHGGLYGRLTHRLFLQPFSLGESEEFLKTKGDDAVKVRDGRALHDSQVKQRLGIAGVSTNLYSWRSRIVGRLISGPLR